MNTLKTIIGIVLFLSPFLGIAQNWGGVGLTVNSARGNNNCHNPGKRYDFSFSVTLPTPGTGETYTMLPQTGVIDRNGKQSIYQDLGGDTRVTSKTYGNATSGDFQVNYDDAWDLNAIVLEVSILVSYEKKSDGVVVQTGQRDFKTLITIPLNNLNTPAHINVNGTNQTRLDFYATNSCGVYTLTAPSQNATYTWSLPNNAWFYNSSSTGNSIQIRPTWNVSGAGSTVFLGNITLTAKKYCDGLTQKSKTFPVYVHLPAIHANRSEVCYNGSGSNFYIPSVSSGNTVTWHVDHSKVNVLSGQYTSSVSIKANNYYSQYSDVVAVISNGCGQSATLTKTTWLGRPAYQSSTLTGPSNGTPGTTSTFIGTPATGATSYYWTLPFGSSGPLQTNCYDCWKINYSGVDGGGRPYANIQMGTQSGQVQAVYQNSCGDVGAWLYVNISNPNTGGGLPGGGGGIGGGIGPAIPRIGNVDQTTGDAIVIKAYPNPATDRLHIDLGMEKKSKKKITLRLYHLTTGQEIQRVVTKPKTTLDVSEMTAGTYVLEVITDERIERRQVVIL